MSSLILTVVGTYLTNILINNLGNISVAISSLAELAHFASPTAMEYNSNILLVQSFIPFY